ncbi:MAG: hypothetical protein FD146_336 [Anaerolineaceae bacterium]|nr:MAG: hypothetical protein FD146_336 [Anaerolineaceae bacterium]
MARANLNFSDPFQGRRWLKYLRPDPRSGLRLLPNIDDDGRQLGFSLRSNALGLRGPENPRAAGVISGTSFAMGFAVDNGRNWYDLAFDPTGWLNLGLPVGVKELNALLDELYRGPEETLLFLYHPNVYTFTRNFALAQAWKRNLFEAMGWETRLFKCIELKARKQVRQLRGLRDGSILRFRHGDATYVLSALYNRFDYEKEAETVAQTLAGLHAMFARFRRTLVARVWLKQELVPPQFQNATLWATLANYEQGWELLRKRMYDLPSVTFHAPAGFELSDYYPGDTHWNEAGNRKFATFVRGLLAEAE